MPPHPRIPPAARTLALFLAAATALVSTLIIGCAGVRNVGDPDHPLHSARADAPFVFIHCTPAYGPPWRAGTLVAVWNDGTIVRAASEDQLGQSYVRARLTPEQLAHVRRLLGDSGLLTDHSQSWLIVDAAAETLAVRYDNQVKTWAHSPGFENTSNHDSTDPRITRLKQALLAIPLDNPTPEPAATFSTYPNDWYR